MKKCYCISLILFILLSCSKQQFTQLTTDSVDTRAAEEDYDPALNPYSLSVMKQAINEVQNDSHGNILARDGEIWLPIDPGTDDGPSLPADDFSDIMLILPDFLSPTHHYVKVSPRNEDEYDYLVGIGSEDFYPYPIHCDNGDTEPDEVDADTLPVLWAAVENLDLLAEIDYTVIDEVFIPPVARSPLQRLLFREEDALLLESYALRIAGFEPEPDVRVSSNWTPRGSVWHGTTLPETTYRCKG